MLSTSVGIQVTNEGGEIPMDDLHTGDVWLNPVGMRHSIQALDYGVGLLHVLYQGSSSEEDIDPISCCSSAFLPASSPRSSELTSPPR